MSNLPESSPSDQPDANIPPQSDASPSDEASAESAALQEADSAPKRKIRIGSQRSSTPVSPMKPVPPPLDLRPVKPREASPATVEVKQPEKANEVVQPPAGQPESAAAAQSEAEATIDVEAKPPAEINQENEKSQPSFSELAGEGSPEIAASVAKLLSKTTPPESATPVAPTAPVESLSSTTPVAPASPESPTSPEASTTVAPTETATETAVEIDEADLPRVEFKPQTAEDLEREIEDALGGMSLDDILAEE